MLDAYIHAFAHLRPSRDPSRRPGVNGPGLHKALILLAVSDLIAEGVIKANFIVPDGAFAERFAQYVLAATGEPAQRADLEIAFVELSDEGFWKVSTQPGHPGKLRRALEHLVFSSPAQPRIGAFLDNELFTFMREDSTRHVLQVTLINTYIPLLRRSQWLHARTSITRQTVEISKVINDMPETMGGAGTRTEQTRSTVDSVANDAELGSLDDADQTDDETRWGESLLIAARAEAGDEALSENATEPWQSVESADGLSGVLLDLQGIARSVFTGPLDATWSVVAQTPAGRRQVPLTRLDIEQLPLVASHVREMLRGADYDFDAYWAHVLELPGRAANALFRNQIYTMGSLASLTIRELMGMRSLGVGTLCEICTVLRGELWKWLSRFSPDELIPPTPPPLSNPPQIVAESTTLPHAELRSGTRARRASALYLDTSEVLQAPWAHGPLLSDDALAALRAVGCDADRVALIRLLQGASGVEPKLVRASNVLARERCKTLGAVVRRTPDELLNLRQFGVTCYRTLCDWLRQYFEPWIAQIPRELLDSDATDNEVLVAGRDAIEMWGFDDSDSVDEVGSAAGSEEGDSEQQRLRSGFACLRAAVALMGEENEEHDGSSDITAEIAKLLDGVSVETLFDELKDRAAHLAGVYADNARRDLDVLFARAGVYDGEELTLARLGERRGISRERVRQLERAAQQRLEQPALAEHIGLLATFVDNALNSLGGVTLISTLAEKISQTLSFGAVDATCATRLLVSWSKATRWVGSERLALTHYPEAVIERTESAVRETLEAYPSGLPLDEFVSRVLVTGGVELMRTGRSFVAAIVRSSDTVDIVDGACQPAKRGALYARIIAALQAIQQPAHFTRIAVEYRKRFPDDGKRTDNSIHAFFDRYPETFVLAGNGVYALSAWGYDPAIRDVPSVVLDVLRQAERPLHRDEVVRAVGERYRWKENSVAAALANDRRIRAFGNAFFGLHDRSYGSFDPEAAYAEHFGVQKSVKAAIVLGTYTNGRGHVVTHLRLTAPMLLGQIPLTNIQTRACFDLVGDASALCCAPSREVATVTIHCGKSVVSGLGAWLASVDARAGDGLLVERLADDAEEKFRYLCVHAPKDQTAEAMRLLGLRSDGQAGGDMAGVSQLKGMRSLEAVRQLTWHALEHPWTEISSAQAALGYTDAGTQGSEYRRLGVRCGMLADGQAPERGPGLLFRPTARGRVWAAKSGATGETLPMLGELALGLPAYRRHLRGAATRVEWTSALSPLMIAAWDHRLGLTPGGREISAALESSEAFVLDWEARRSALALLVLLLAAQSHGLGVALDASESCGSWAVEAADMLRAQGVALVTDAAGRVALDERVTLGVDDGHGLETRLRGLDAPFASALADAWRAVEPTFSAAGAVAASELFAALQVKASEVMHDILTTAPAAQSDAGREANGTIIACGFPRLVGDFGWSSEPMSAPFAFWRDAEARARRSGGSPLGVCLCPDLMNWSWDARRHLSANAHLALIVVIAADLDGLAERIRRTDSGWTLGDAPLVSGLDRTLRALGYDVWDEHYRDDGERVAALGVALVVLGERLGLLHSEGPSVAAVGRAASDVYYSVYYAEHDPLGRIREALTQTVSVR